MGNPHLTPLLRARLYEKERSARDVAAKLGIAPEDVLDFSLNINPFGPPPAALAAAREAAARAYAYPPLMLDDLRHAVAEFHGVPESFLFFGDGLDEVIKLLVHGWTGEGDRVLIHIPTFPRYELEVQARGAVPVFVSGATPWTIDIDGIDRRLSTEAVALAFLCTPNNPTSATIECDQIAQWAKAFPDTQFVVDEALIDPREPGAIPLVTRFKNVAVLRTFSKYFGLAGFRVGYAVAAPERLAVLELVRPPFNVSLVSAAAAAAALTDLDFLARSENVFKREAAFIRSALADLQGCHVYGGDSNMLLLHLDGMDSAAVVDALAQKGILVVDGQSFHGLEGWPTLRVSLQDRPANAALVQALRELWSQPGLKAR